MDSSSIMEKYIEQFAYINHRASILFVRIYLVVTEYAFLVRTQKMLYFGVLVSTYAR
jgi:hypothetical protein